MELLDTTFYNYKRAKDFPNSRSNITFGSKMSKAIKIRLVYSLLRFCLKVRPLCYFSM